MNLDLRYSYIQSNQEMAYQALDPHDCYLDAPPQL